jgi:hypothetical protein
MNLVCSAAPFLVMLCVAVLTFGSGKVFAQGEENAGASGGSQRAPAADGSTPLDPSASGAPSSAEAAESSPVQEHGVSSAAAAGGTGGTAAQADMAKEPSQPAKSSIVDSVKLGVSAWITQGDTKWSHNASALDSSLGNPSSRLQYKDVGTNIVELAPQVKFKSGWLLQGSVGYGSVGGGRVTDDDFFKVDGGQPSSRTIHDINGDYVLYVNGDVGYSILKLLKLPERHGSLDMFVGYQFRKEKHDAVSTGTVICTPTGQTNGVCNAPGTPGAERSMGQPVFTNTQTWHAARIGLQGEWRIFRRLSIDGKAAFLPFTALTNEDVHHTNPVLQQNPSISMSGIGIGANLEGNLNVMVIENLFLSVGYRYWWNRVTNENCDFHFVNFPNVSTKLNEFQNIRAGVTFGVNYRF